jgi:hypothetical protein
MTGAAGVHLLAGLLSAMNRPVAISQKNIPNVDLFVGSLSGSAVAIQVKTMRWARRKGFYEWRCNPTRLSKGFYAFVDLRQHRGDEFLSELPDIFIVPVAVVGKWKHFPPKESFVKPTERELLRYKNEKGWNMLLRKLGR